MAVLSLSGCGSESGADAITAEVIEQAFRDQGIVLHRLPTSGAEQPTMGLTSSCATRYSAATAQGTVIVAICDDAASTTSVGRAPAFRRTHRNVVADYSGRDAATRNRIIRALDALD